MIQEGCNKFFWGFLFILFNFRIQGVDILPDIIGYILFAMGFQALAGYSEHFAKGKIFNLVLVFLSVFTIYQQPNQGEETQINPIGIIMGVVTLVLLLVVVYRLLMGIKDMASSRNRSDIMKEAEKKWSFFLVFQIASLFLFVLILIPPLFMVTVIVMFVVSIVLMVSFMRFMRVCGEQLSHS